MNDPQAYGRVNDASPEKLRQRRTNGLLQSIEYHKSCIEEDQKRLDELRKQESKSDDQ